MNINDNTNSLLSNEYQYPKEDFFTPTTKDIYLYDYTNIGETLSYSGFHTFYVSEDYNEQGEACYLDQLAFRIDPSFTMPPNSVLKLKLTDTSGNIVKCRARASWKPGVLWADLAASGLSNEERTFIMGQGYGMTVLIEETLTDALLPPSFAPIMSERSTQRTYVHAIGVVGTPYPESTPYPEEGFFTRSNRDLYINDYHGTEYLSCEVGGSYTIYFEADVPQGTPVRIDKFEVVACDDSSDFSEDRIECYVELGSEFFVPIKKEERRYVVDLVSAGIPADIRTQPYERTSLSFKIRTKGAHRIVPLLTNMNNNQPLIHIMGGDRGSSSSSSSYLDCSYDDYHSEEDNYLPPEHELNSSSSDSTSVNPSISYTISIQEGSDSSTRNKRVIGYPPETEAEADQGNILISLHEEFLDSPPSKEDFKYYPYVRWFICPMGSNGEPISNNRGEDKLQDLAWKPIGNDPYLNYQPDEPGIYHLMAVLINKDHPNFNPNKEYDYNDPDVSTIDYIRQFDCETKWKENLVPKLKKGKKGCFGVAKSKWDRLLVLKAAEKLGDKTYARSSQLNSTDMDYLTRKHDPPNRKDILRLVTDPPGNNSYKCNYLVFIAANRVYDEALHYYNGSSHLNYTQYRLDILTYSKTYVKEVAPLVEHHKKSNLILNQWRFVPVSTTDKEGKTVLTRPAPGWFVMNNTHIGIVDYDGAWINAGASYGVARHYHLDSTKSVDDPNTNTKVLVSNIVGFRTQDNRYPLGTEMPLRPTDSDYPYKN